MRNRMMGWLGLGLVGCGGLGDLEVIDGALPGVALVNIEGADEGTATVTFELSTGEVQTTTGPLPGPIPQLGLRAGGDYTVRAEVTTSSGRTMTSGDVAFQAMPAPSVAPTFVRQVYDEARVCDPNARMLVSWLEREETGVTILDRDGNFRWVLPTADGNEQINRARVARDGSSLHYLFVDLGRDDDLATIVTQPLDGSPPTSTRALWGHHDFVELPDGTLGWLGYDFADISPEEIVGLPSPWEGRDPLPTAADTIHEAPAGTADVTDVDTVINLYDDYFPDHPIVYTSFDLFRFGGFLPGYHELTHGNSLALVGDTYLMMLRWVDSVVGVDRTTGESWTLGGVYNEFSPSGASTLDDLFLQPHFSDAWQADDGLHMLVFDNRPEGEDSRLSEYVIDVDSRTFERIWTFDVGYDEQVIGDVQRINIEGCDNLLVTFSGKGRLLEMTREGDIVWEVATRAGFGLARAQYLPSLDDPTAAVYRE